MLAAVIPKSGNQFSSRSLWVDHFAASMISRVADDSKMTLSMELMNQAEVAEVEEDASRAFDVRQRTAHLVGLCGSGMRALAEFLVDAGWRVSGSDLRVSPAEQSHFHDLGIAVSVGITPPEFTADLELLVYSPAVPETDTDRRRAGERGIEQLSYPQMLGRLMRDRVAVCVAGTHGKSTTTAMTGWILRSAGLAPGVIVGAELRELGRSGWDGGGRPIVVESCEYQRHFWEYTPTNAAVLAVEPDHFDCFANFDETRAAFERFVRRLPASGSLLVPALDPSGIDWQGVTASRVETFGIERVADWSAVGIRTTRTGSRLTIQRAGTDWGTLELPLPGRHNVVNALVAAALATAAGANPLACVRGLESFPGIRRRFENHGIWSGVTIIDDYAHHPTAIAATVDCARQQFPNQRLVGVFQPHQFSRTEALFEEFANALARLDMCFVSPVFTARERVEPVEAERTSERLCQRISELSGKAEFLVALDPVPRTLDDSLRAGDVLLTMGAGDISQLHHAFTRRLQRNHGS